MNEDDLNSEKREIGHVLCVTNMSSKTRASDLKQLFSKHGKVIYLHTHTHINTLTYKYINIYIEYNYSNTKVFIKILKNCFFRNLINLIKKIFIFVGLNFLQKKIKTKVLVNKF
jgi:RNA recognition motif-containing protein